jgi:hypothetical protein
MSDSPLNNALRAFEKAEANLLKLEKLWEEIQEIIPGSGSIVFFDPLPEYEDNCRSFEAILEVLPKIDGWKPEIVVLDLNAIAQNRLDARELGEIEIITSTEREIQEPGRLLGEYRYRFNQKRKELVRETIGGLIDNIDENLAILCREQEPHADSKQLVNSPQFDALKEQVAQIDMLLGSSVSRPDRWRDLHRHLRWAQIGDLHDIINLDWPQVKSGIRKALYGEKEPIPVEIEDLSTLVNKKPTGAVAIRLAWERLNEEDFERLINCVKMQAKK